jgi:TPR repeat protein
MYNIAALYESGHGIEQNLKAAYDWYSRSADLGTASAMYSLGKMLEEGRGLPADKAEAHAWLTLAGRYFSAAEQQEVKANADALRALTPTLTERDAQRARDIAKNLGERIEERRKAPPIKAGPGETET